MRAVLVTAVILTSFVTPAFSATFTVINTLASGPGSPDAAISNANFFADLTSSATGSVVIKGFSITGLRHWEI